MVKTLQKFSFPGLLKGYGPNLILSMSEPCQMIIFCVFHKVWVMNASTIAHTLPKIVKKLMKICFDNFLRNWIGSCENKFL